ncbi:transposase IS4 family protein [endosymbiont of Acanthamoeba sp. UWC8]|uniref:hypothetical protein n=1 Tax=endosymbiont of Acanthamoeba sp. UWC8 TaxID=86106 RepID=UPI0004D12587|nr:hypothetical protein [endosymbiont of Acanthamoeba sp. UWC8]AIF80969.1 transposase IS4 family protein [endosymbiont of Acanthamoeba sp. UWC8]
MFASLIDIFSAVDNFCKHFDKSCGRFLIRGDNKRRQRACRMTLSEIMTIMILFHISNYRTFKEYYKDCILNHLKSCFPNSVSYNRFVELIPVGIMPLTAFLHGMRGKETNIYFL